MNKNETISCVNYDSRKEWESWTLGSICPSCGSDEIEYNTQLVLTSNPPQSQLRCKHCGRYFSSGIVPRLVSQDDIADTEYLKKLFEHDQSILGTPKVGDWPFAPTPCDTPSYPDIYQFDKKSQVGWICPKCGRCLAPHLDSCSYCSGPTTINITY